MTNDRTASRFVARGLAVLVLGGAVALALVGSAVAKGPPSSHPSPGPKGPHASAQPSGSPEAQVPKGAVKVGLYLDTAFSCTTTPVPARGSKAHGFAVLNTTANGMLNVTVSLKRAAPNATFTITIDQGAGGCGATASPSPSPTSGASASASPSAPVAPTITLRTNRKGNGTVHLRIPIVAGATTFSVTATGPDQALRSKGVRLIVKKPAASPSGSPSTSPSTSPSA